MYSILRNHKKTKFLTIVSRHSFAKTLQNCKRNVWRPLSEGTTIAGKSPSNPYLVTTTSFAKFHHSHVCGLHNTGMAVIREQDLGKGRAAFEQWQDAAHNIFSEQLPADDDAAFDFRLNFAASAAPAVGDGGALLAIPAGKEGAGRRRGGARGTVGAIKILDGPASDPHNSRRRTSSNWTPTCG